MSEFGVRVLHISDLHMRDDRTEPRGWRARQVLGAAWEKNLDDIVQAGAVDLVCFTGDLVQSGKAEEYAVLTPFVEALLGRLNVPRDRFFVVPGNHDIDRSAAKTAWKKLRELGESEGEGVSRWMAGESRPSRFKAAYHDQVLARQTAYRAWVRDGLKRPELLPGALHPRLGYRVTLRLDGRPFDIHIIGLDSAWLAGNDADARKIRLTDDQVARLSEGLPGFRLALMHHPLDELADGNTCRDLLASQTDLLLRGHLHETRLSLWSEPNRALREVASGCLYQSNTYRNGCTIIELRLDENGRPRLPYRFWFRGWSPRGFWTDDSTLYEGSRGGVLTWPEIDEDVSRLPHPRAPELFVGRTQELAHLVATLLPTSGPPQPVAVLAVQGMPGVGKSYLIDHFAHLYRDRFPGGYRTLSLEPNSKLSVDALGSRLATLVGQCTWDTAGAWDELAFRLIRASAVLVHIENLDSAEQVPAVVALVSRLKGCAIVVSGRSQRFGSAPMFQRVTVEPLDSDTSLRMLAAEIGPATSPTAEVERHGLVRVLGFLPLALHLAAGYLTAGHSVVGFLERLRAQGYALEPALLDDPLYLVDRARAIISTTFELSLGLLRSKLNQRADAGMAGFATLGHAPSDGVSLSLGAAIAGLDETNFEVLVVDAVHLSLASGTSETGWRIHPLLAELLRQKVTSSGWQDRMTNWFMDRLPEKAPGEEDEQGRCWRELHRDRAALELWLETLPLKSMPEVARMGSNFATLMGPFKIWIDFCERLLPPTDDPELRSHVLWTLANVAKSAGALQRATEVAKEKIALDRSRGDVREAANAVSVIADILQAQGDLDEALRIRREEQIPVYESLGDVRSLAATLGQVADIFQARGENVEALRVRREEQLPVYERLGDVRSRAITLGKIADILLVQGDIDEALRIRQEEELPTFERLGDVRLRAVTLGRIADILQGRGNLKEALRIRREEELPVFERLGEPRERAIAVGKVADILQLWGDLDEALRIRREEEIPVFERLGDLRSRAIAIGKVADIRQAQGALTEALRLHREEELPVFERLGDARMRVVALGRVADILQLLDDPEEALRIRREEEIPFYERVGDVRSRALTLGKVADILQAQGDLEEPMRICQGVLLVYEQLGDLRSLLFGRTSLAQMLLKRGTPDDREKAAVLLGLAMTAAEAMQIPEVATIRNIQLHHGL